MRTHLLVPTDDNQWTTICRNIQVGTRETVTTDPDLVTCPRCLQTGIPHHTLTGVVEPTTLNPEADLVRDHPDNTTPPCPCGQPLAECMNPTDLGPERWRIPCADRP